MSAHDFQGKCASVMDTILQTAIAEATKLFEAMVDELKAEMSRVQKENDELKAGRRGCGCAHVSADAPERRHRAVQCDIIPFCNVLVEQHQPSVPNRHNHQETIYPFQEHNYDVRGRIVVRHKSVSRGEGVNSPYSCGGPPSVNGQTDSVLQQYADLGSACGGPPPSLQPSYRHMSEALQDAKLLMEAMSSSVEAVSCPSVGAVQAADGAPTDLQISPHSFESPKAFRSLFIKEAAAAESSQETVNVTQPSETGPQVRVSTAAAPTTAQPLVQHGSSPLKTSTPTLMITPKLSSVESCNPAAHSSTLVSAIAAKVDTTKNHGRAPILPHGAPKTSSVPVKSPFISSAVSLPAADVGELPLGMPQHPTIKTVVLTPLPEPCERASNLPSQEEKKTLETPNAPDVVTTGSQNGDNSSEKSLSHNHSSKEQNEYSQSSFSFRSAPGLKVPPSFHLKPSAVVRLNRLTFLMSDKESVLISRLSVGAGWDNQSALTQDAGHHESSSSEELPSVGFPRSARPSGEAPALLEESAGTFSNSGASAQTGSPSGQPVEDQTSSKDEEMESPSCTETHSRKRRSFQRDGFKTHLGNRIAPKSEVEENQHKGTQTVNRMKEPQDSKIKRNVPETVEAVAAVWTDASPIQTRKSRLCDDVPRPALSKDKDPDDDISHSMQGKTIKNTKNTTLCTSPSSPVKNVTGPRNTRLGLRHTNIIPRRRGRTGLIQDAGKPKSAQSVSIASKNSDSEVIYSKPQTRAAVSGEDNEKGSSSSSSRRATTHGTSTRNDRRDSQVKPTIVKKTRILRADTNPKTNLKVVNAKMLAKKAKANMVRTKTSNQPLQKSAKTTGLEENRPSSVAVKKIQSSGVWIPPVIPTTGKESEHVSVKKEMASLQPPDRGGVHSAGVSVHPVKAAPVASPLQPLSLIGSRLLKNQCGECGQVLSSSAALESHVGLHAGRRPFSCRLCGKCFTDTKGLKGHGRVHRNGRIHVCQKCGKGFVYKFSLTKHLQMVHRRIKPFVCQICNKGFFTKLDVEYHIRIHTGEKPFHCDLCERKFIRRVDLNVHLRWHNGEKRYWCSYCGKGFLDFNNLKRHKYIHTGEKPYPCAHCPKHFTQSGHLKKHVKNVHKMAGGPQFLNKRKP